MVDIAVREGSNRKPRKDVAILKLLLANGAEIDDNSNSAKFTAFHSACYGGFLDSAQVLLDARCNTKLRDLEGLAGYDLAVEHIW